MEKEICNCGGGRGGGGGRRWRRNNSGRELGPPAFLTKTYTIVDDPSTNSIISWGEFGDSFIIWDHLTFSAQILHKYFKHNNLSSFVYQLNSYGFRKIGVDHQWEYRHPDFQRGKLHLLNKVKRRGKTPESHAAAADQEHRAKRAVPDHTSLVEVLANETREWRMEIKKMKSQVEDAEFHIMALEEEAKKAANEKKRLMACWGKACEVIAQKMIEESDDHVEGSKKSNNEQDDQVQPVSSTNENDDHDQANASNSESITDKILADYAYWNSILLGDDDDDEAACGNEAEKKKAKIALEFKNLIEKLEGYDDHKS